MKYFILTFFFLIFLSVYAQQKNTPQIANVDISFNGDKVLIAYDIINAAATDEFTVTIEVLKKSGNTINTISLSGDLGKSIYGGASKKIVWDSRKDGYILDEPIIVSVSATPKIKIPYTSHLFKSAVLPGLGDYHLNNGNLHFLYGVGAYGSIAAAIAMNYTAAATYTDYLGSMKIIERNNYYNWVWL